MNDHVEKLDFHGFFYRKHADEWSDWKLFKKLYIRPAGLNNEDKQRKFAILLNSISQQESKIFSNFKCDIGKVTL